MNVHQEWLNKIKGFSTELKLPPPSLKELKMEYLEIIPEKKMVAKLPFQERFTNPIGAYQGGFIAAGIDEVFGPLSYLSHQGPTVTISMNITFLKPFTSQLPHCLINAEVLKMTKNFIFMRAEVTTPSGDLLAHAETHVQRIQK